MEPFTKSFLQEISNSETVAKKKSEDNFNKCVKKIIELAKKGQTYAFIIGIPLLSLRKDKLEKEEKNLEKNILPLYKTQFQECEISLMDLPTLSYTADEFVLELNLQKQLFAMKNNTLTAINTYVDFDKTRISRYIFLSWT